MGIIFKQGFWVTSITYIGIIIGFVNVTYLFPLYFTTQEFGTRSLLIDSVLILSQFSLFGIYPSVFKFQHLFGELKEKKTGMFLFFSITFLLFFFTFCFLYWGFIEKPFVKSFSESSKYYAQISYLIIPFLFSFSLYSFFECLSKSTLLSVWSSFTKEILTRVLTTLLLLLYSFEIITIEQFWIGYIIIYLITSIILFIILTLYKKIDFKWPSNKLNSIFLKPFITYCFFAFLSGASGIIIVKIDSVMIGQSISESFVGIYAIAIFFSSTIDIPRRSITQIITPIASQCLASNNMSKLKTIYSETSIYLQLLGSVLLLLIWTNIDFIYSMIPKEDYTIGKYAFLFLGMAKLIDMTFSINGEIITYSKKYKANLIIQIILVIVTISLNYLFIERWGITGAALASAIAILFINVIRFLFIKYYFNLNPFKLSNGIIVVLSIVVLLFNEIDFIKFNLFVNGIINVIVILGSFILLIFLNKDFVIIKNKITNLIIKK